MSNNKKVIESVEQYVNEEFSIIKQQISTVLTQYKAGVEKAIEDAGVAKSHSILLSRVVFDLVLGKEIKRTNSEKYGEVIDRQYYADQLEALGDVDSFIAGVEVSSEEIQEAKNKKKNDQFTNMCIALIETIVDSGYETHLRKAARDNKLVDYMKNQKTGIDWYDEMEEVAKLAYDRYMDKISELRKKILEDSVNQIFFEDNSNPIVDDYFIERVKKSFIKRAERPFIWRDELKDWIPSAIEESEKLADAENMKRVERATKFASKWEDLQDGVNELIDLVNRKDYSGAIKQYSNISNIAHRRSHEARLNGDMN